MKLSFQAFRLLEFSRKVTVSSVKLLTKPTFGKNILRRNIRTSFKSFTVIEPIVMPAEKPFERLPKTIVPKHYNLTLQPDLNTFKIYGSEAITLEVKGSTNTVKLNSLEITIESAELTTSTDEVVASSSIDVDAETEVATITFPSSIPTGNAELRLKFQGILNDKMKGFYRSKYTAANGEVRYGAVTQFESTDARRAFPCWDEPALKATFDVSLVVPNDRVALSNTNVLSEEPVPGDTNLRTVKFSTTPVMSTYLVAAVVGEYDFVEGQSVDGVNVRVYTPLGKKEQGEFALNVAVKVLPYYKDYFKVAYPLPKLDLIAIPDFASGAMENWGLVTYRETALLVSERDSSCSCRQWIALVISHEIAHQWFGNLVTMEWWTHLWLNEGFATWIEFLVVDHLFPEMNVWTQFVTDTLIRALELDALRNSHPIEVAVGHPAEVEEIFDNISYNKGASIIRMLHSFIGDEDFRKGMHHYLTKFQYSNTFTEDLWASLEHASGKPIGEVMSTWTQQMGFPLIKVSERQEGTSRILTLTQEKFCADPSDLKNDNSQWMVPVMISTKRFPAQVAETFLLDSKSAEVTIEDVLAEDWVKVNPGTVGYYRVQYPSEMLGKFLDSVCDQTLPPLDRLGLVDDLFALVQGGQASTVDALNLMEAFTNEDNYVVWSCLNNCVGKLSLLLSHTDMVSDFHKYGRTLMQSVTDKIGWDPKDDEGHLDVLLRGLVLTRMGSFGHEATAAEAKSRFACHLDKSKILDADLRAPVYRTVMKTGDKDTIESMLKLYRETDLREEKDRIMRALGNLSDRGLLTEVLDFAMTEEVRNQDKVFVFISVALNRHGRQLAWDYFREHIDQFIKWYSGGHLITYLVKYLTENFASEEKAQEVEAFFKLHPIPSAERTIQQSLESIRLNESWLNRDEDKIRSWFNSRR